MMSIPDNSREVAELTAEVARLTEANQILREEYEKDRGNDHVKIVELTVEVERKDKALREIEDELDHMFKPVTQQWPGWLVRIRDTLQAALKGEQS
jgi:hypothetical protein